MDELYEIPRIEVRLRLQESGKLYSASPINSPEAAVHVMAEALKDLDREVVCIVNMDIKNRPINFNVASIGGISASLVSVPSIFKAAILSNASSIMLLHTHPSGEPDPSWEDDAITRKVFEACLLMDVNLTDHVIIGSGTGQIYSYRSEKPELFELSSIGVKEPTAEYSTNKEDIIQEIRPMTKAEMMYCYTQSMQIRSQTGNIGYLRADMDTDGNGFYSSWNEFHPEWKTPEFKSEFDQIINRLRFGETSESFLTNRKVLAKYCFSHPGAAINDTEFGFRVDTDRYAYMMRLNPNKGEYNLYCYCYRKDWLNNHMKEAERGIRFIDSNYNNKFFLPDGGKVRITYPDGDKREETCRYIDSTHVEMGKGALNLYHICELAEILESQRAEIEPADGVEIKRIDRER